MKTSSYNFLLLKTPVKKRRKIKPLGLGLRSITQRSLKRTRSACWIDDALERTNLNVSQFSEEYVQKTPEHKTKSVHEWFNQIHSVSENSVERLNRKLPNSRFIYDLPLWDLISEAKKAKRILSVLYQYYNAETGYWSFPNDLARIFSSKRQKADFYIPTWWYPRKMNNQNKVQLSPVKGFFNYEGLLNRGDIYGFIALLGLVRYSEAKKSFSLFQSSYAALHKSIPSLCRHKAFSRAYSLIMWELGAIKVKSDAVLDGIDVDLDKIHEEVVNERNLMTKIG